MDANGMSRDDLLGTSLLAWTAAGLLALYLLAHPAGRPWGAVVGLIGLGLALLAGRPWAWAAAAGPFALALLPAGPAAATLAGSGLLAALLALGRKARRGVSRRPARLETRHCRRRRARAGFPPPRAGGQGEAGRGQGPPACLGSRGRGNTAADLKSTKFGLFNGRTHCTSGAKRLNRRGLCKAECRGRQDFLDFQPSDVACPIPSLCVLCALCGENAACSRKRPNFMTGG